MIQKRSELKSLGNRILQNIRSAMALMPSRHDDLTIVVLLPTEGQHLTFRSQKLIFSKTDSLQIIAAPRQFPSGFTSPHFDHRHLRVF